MVEMYNKVLELWLLFMISVYAVASGQESVLGHEQITMATEMVWLAAQDQDIVEIKDFIFDELSLPSSYLLESTSAFTMKDGTQVYKCEIRINIFDSLCTVVAIRSGDNLLLHNSTCPVVNLQKREAIDLHDERISMIDQWLKKGNAFMSKDLTFVDCTFADADAGIYKLLYRDEMKEDCQVEVKVQEDGSKRITENNCNVAEEVDFGSIAKVPFQDSSGSAHSNNVYSNLNLMAMVMQSLCLSYFFATIHLNIIL